MNRIKEVFNKVSGKQLVSKKIKVPPYPSYQITKVAFDNVVSNSVKTSDSKPLSNQLVALVTFKSGEKRVVKSRPVRHEGNLYITTFPNPVHLFFKSAIEQYNISEDVKATEFSKYGKRMNSDSYLLDFEKDGTHASYNNYIQHRLSAILMLVSGIEAFLNHIIPNDFIYVAERSGKTIKFNKQEIEGTKISFREKLLDVIPQWLNEKSFWNKLEKEKNIILQLYSDRKNIVHLKTNAEDDFARYFDTIDKMLDLNICEAINDSIKFVNTVSPNFIDYEK